MCAYRQQRIAAGGGCLLRRIFNNAVDIGRFVIAGVADEFNEILGCTEVLIVFPMRNNEISFSFRGPLVGHLTLVQHDQIVE